MFIDQSNRDLKAVFVWSLAMLLLVFTDTGFVSVVLRVIIAVPLVFLLSGHVILRAIGFTVDSVIEYSVYAVGTSIAGCVLGGFVLNWLSALRPIGWAVWFVILTGAAMLIALRRHYNGGFSLSFPKMQRWHAMVLGCAVLLTIGAYGLALYDEANDREFKYTEFWMVPKAGKVFVGIKNAENTTEQYNVEIATNGEFIAKWGPIVIEPGQTWVRNFMVSASDTPHKIEGKLYKDQIIYRKVSMMVGE